MTVAESDSTLNLLSLGAGVQSSTLALMAARGLLPYRVDAAIFSDTKGEPKKVYEWLEWLEQQLPFPVYRVCKGDLKQNILKTGPGRVVSVPFYTRFSKTAIDDAGNVIQLRGKGKAEGMTRRQCTLEYKIEPIHKKVRELVGLKPRQRGPKRIIVNQLIGISLDEMQRMKASGHAWIQNVYPLIDARLTRFQCIEWLRAEFGREPPKSACFFCPYHDDAMWRDMKLNDPESFAEAVVIDRHIRTPEASVAKGMNQGLYLHRSCKPIEDIDFSNAADWGQGALDFEDGFQGECEGMCGV